MLQMKLAAGSSVSVSNQMARDSGSRRNGIDFDIRNKTLGGGHAVLGT